MDAFASAEPKFTPSELERLNRCRLYLKADTLSDITDGSGNFIGKQYSDGNRDPDRIIYHDWPEQRRPGPSEWTLWRKALRVCFASTSIRAIRQLDTPLGGWIDGYRDKWKWFYLPTQKHFYCRYGVKWKMYKLNNN